MEGYRGLAKGISTRLSKSNTELQGLRHFGFLVGGIFAVLSLWPVVFRGQAPRLWAAIPAAILIAFGFAAPMALRPIHWLWLQLGHTLGWINTCILLSAVYFLMVTPIGVVMRLLGRDPLKRRLRDGSSYWIDREQPGHGRRSMELKF